MNAWASGLSNNGVSAMTVALSIGLKVNVDPTHEF